MKNFIVPIFITIISINCYLLYSNYEKKIINEKLQKHIFSEQAKSNDIIETIPLYVKRNSKELIPKELLIDQDTSATLLVFRFRNTHCDPCVKKQLDILSKEKNLNKSRQLLLIGDFMNIKELEDFKKEYKFENVTYSKNLEIKLDKLDRPYFLIIKNAQILDNFFIPSSYTSKLTEGFLKFFIQTHLQKI